MDNESGHIPNDRWEINVDLANIYNIRHKKYIDIYRYLRRTIRAKGQSEEQKIAAIQDYMLSIAYMPSALESVCGALARSASDSQARLDIARVSPLYGEIASQKWPVEVRDGAALFILQTGSIPLKIEDADRDLGREREEINKGFAAALATFDYDTLTSSLNCAERLIAEDISQRERFLSLTNTLIESLLRPRILISATITNTSQYPLTIHPIGALQVSGASAPLAREALIHDATNDSPTTSLIEALGQGIDISDSTSQTKYITIPPGETLTTSWRAQFSGDHDAWLRLEAAYTSASLECQIAVETVTRSTTFTSPPALFARDMQSDKTQLKEAVNRLFPHPRN